MKNEKSKWITYSLTDCLVKLAKKNKKFVVLDADLSDDLGLKNSLIFILRDLFRTV